MEGNASASSSGTSSSSSTAVPSSTLPPTAPKILLAKPGPGPAGSRFPRDDDSSAVLRSRPSSLGSVNLLSPDTWEFHIDRALPFLTENTDFTVIGVIGPSGVGKSTILNEIYGFDGTSPGMLPPFVTQTDEIRAMAKHCTSGIEMRVSMERHILLDTQPLFSPSILAEMMKPDGSSTIPLLNGETLTADLAHELMGIQLGVFLSSVCHMLLVVSEGVHDTELWDLMLTVDLLKHSIPDPSMLGSVYNRSSNGGPEKENKDNLVETGEEFLASLVFVHSRLQEHELSPSNIKLLHERLLNHFEASSFQKNTRNELIDFSCKDRSSAGPELFLLTRKENKFNKPQYESYGSLMGKLRDRILSKKWNSFGKPISEREWVRNTAKIWEMVKKSSVIAEYCRSMQNSGFC